MKSKRKTSNPVNPKTGNETSQGYGVATTAWELSEPLDDGVNADVIDRETAFTIAEVIPSGGESLDQWDAECIARARVIVAALDMRKALATIRTLGHRASHANAPDVLLKCVALAEFALCVAETGKAPR